MIGNTLFQPQRFLLSIAIGVILGVFYDITLFPHILKKARVFFQITADLLFFAITAVFYIAVNFRYTDFDLSFYMIVGNLLGFLLERKSIAILLAKTYKIVYNLIKKFCRAVRKNGEHQGSSEGTQGD